MINHLTGKKIDDTYINSKDGKGYIFDIKRPAFVSNLTTYSQDNEASFNDMETRIGLGNYSLRRVNFLKPPIKARRSGFQNINSIKSKTIEEIIKEGLKIKYEEPDPWDIQWLDAKKVIVDRLTKVTAINPIPATEVEIAEYLSKYPPLNRQQRTRPVNKNPLEDSNKPIKDQLALIGNNIKEVTQKVEKNTLDANINAVKQLSETQALDIWTRNQMAQLQGILTQTNLNSDNGQNLLGSKLQQVVQQLTLQKALVNNLLMLSVKKLNIDTSSIDLINIDQLIQTDYKLAIMDLFGKYYPSQDVTEVYFEFRRQDGTDVMINLDRILQIMQSIPDGRNVYLYNDSANKKISFIYNDNPQVPLQPLSLQEQTAISKADFSILGSQSNIEPTVQLAPQSYLPPEIIEYKDPDREQSIQTIIQQLQRSIEHIAETNYKAEYDKIINPNLDFITDINKRIIRINVNYRLNDKLIQYNPDFLKIELFTGTTPDIVLYKTKNIFDYTYNVGDNYVYFVWYVTLGDVNDLNNWNIAKKYITDVLDERKKQANIYALQARASNDIVQNTKSSKGLTVEEIVANANEAVDSIEQDKNKYYAKKKEADDEADKKAAEAEAVKRFQEEQDDIIKKDAQEVQDAKDAKDAKDKKYKQQLLIEMNNYTKKQNISNINYNLERLEFLYTTMEPFVRNINSPVISMNYGIISLNKFEDFNKLFLIKNDYVFGKKNYNITKKLYNSIFNNSLLIADEINKDIENINNQIKQASIKKKLKKEPKLMPLIDIVKLKSSQKYSEQEPLDTMDTIEKTMKANEQKVAGSGIRSFHKINSINDIYKKSMKKTNGEGLKLAGKGRKVNPWIEHVKKFRESNPNLKYTEVLKQAKTTYKKM
jgi:hypothetical protein